MNHRAKYSSSRPISVKRAAIEYILELAHDLIPTRLIRDKCSEWIEKNVIITEGVAPGPYSFRLTPYLQEIADNFSVMSNVQEFAVIKANQLGFSIVSMGAILYYISHGLGPQLFVSGDASMAEEAFEKRLDPMIEAAGMRDQIKSVVAKKHGHTTGDTKGVKSYAGTFIRAVGPNSEGKLRSFPSRINIIEELDVFPQSLKGTGNPVEKVVRRADSFGPLKRIYYNSTPKQKATSQILPLIEQGDWRLYMWTCPHCGKQQPFIWDGFGWSTDEHGAPDIQIEDGIVVKDPVYYECQNPDCRHSFNNADKFRLLKNRAQGGTAEWIPTRKATRPGLRSYQLPAWYSPFRAWHEIIAQYWRVKDDPLLWPDFVNDVRAECSEETISKPEPHYLAMRAVNEHSQQDSHLPPEVIFTTLATDVQADRLESCLMGWGKNHEAWVLKYWTFDGVTADVDAKCWKQLAEITETEYDREDGKYIGCPKVAIVDSGFNTQAVNTFCAQYPPIPGDLSGVYPAEGMETMREKYYKLFDTEIANKKIAFHDQNFKKMVYHYLSRDKVGQSVDYPRGYIHFARDLHEDFYKQLVAEEMYKEIARSGNVSIKIQNRKQRRNEALDVVKMNYLAMYYLFLGYFDGVNAARRRNKRAEVEKNIDTFMDMMEAANG